MKERIDHAGQLFGLALYGNCAIPPSSELPANDGREEKGSQGHSIREA
jgi:hypothetical protein